MKSLLFTVFIFLINLVSYAQKEVIFPKEFPSELIGKKLCGSVSTTGKMLNGQKAFLTIPVELYITNEEGIYARYNQREQFGEDDWGSTQKITNFELYKTVDNKDQYGDVIGKEYHYKCPGYDVNSNHNIASFYIYDFFGSNTMSPRKSVYFKVFVKSYESATIASNNPKISVCETFKTREEINAENENIIKKINESISIGNIDQALLDYKKLLIPNSSVKTSIQNALNSIIPGNNKPFSNEQVLNITRTYLDFFIKQEPSSYSILLNKEGKLELKNMKDLSTQFIATNKSFLTDGDFILPYSFESELIISETKSKVDKDSIRYVFSDKFKRKDIYISQKGNYYIGKFGAPLSAERLNAPQFISDQVLKGNIELEALTKTEKKANNMVLGDKKSWELEKTIPVKKGTGRKVFRIVTSPIWGLFYVYLLLT
jgi:hypothetical protein